MTTGAGKKSKAKSKKALSVDFKKVKSKVGRKLAPAQNATKVEYKAKGIVIPGQSLAQDKDGLAVNQRKQTLKELLVQSTHYNERTRRDALVGLKDLFVKHPKELVMHAVMVVEKLSPRITDSEKSVRQALALLLRSSILPQLQQSMMKPLIPVIMAHVSSAMTHLVLDIRLAACTFLDLLVQHCPTLVVPFYSGQIIQHYVDLLGKGGISGQAGRTLAAVLSSVAHFLSALQLRTTAQPSEGSLASSATHTWGKNCDTGKQGALESRQALHGYKSEIPTGGHSVSQLANQHPQSMLRTGRPVQTSSTSSQLVPVLLQCWAESAPMVCSAPNPDVSSLDCMVLITKSLCHIFQTLTREAAVAFLARDISSKALIHVPEHGSEEWDFRQRMNQEFYPGLLKHLLSVFPMPAPVVRLPQKVEESLVALNVGICETMLQFVLPVSDDMVYHQNDGVLQYFEGALCGMMLPSSQFSEGMSNLKLAEPHIKVLLQYVPGLVMCVSSDWAQTILRAFTQAFESCSSRSNTKMICLSSMTQLVLSGGKSRNANNGTRLASMEFQTQWLQSLPKLLWELKHLHPSVSQTVLEMLLCIGRSLVEGSPLAESYSGLQHAMVPFFCSFLPSKQDGEIRFLYGPFIKLSKLCQELATDLMFYFSSISPLLLKAVAQCALCPDVDAAVSVRTVEVLHAAFCRGAIGITEYLSFLLTLLTGQVPLQAGSSMTKSPMEAADTGTSHDFLALHLRKRHSAITGVVCACLSQIGDRKLILSLLGPSIQGELEKQPKLRVVHGLFRVVAVLGFKDGLTLPNALVEVLPKSAADFLIRLAEKNDDVKTPGQAAVLTALERPCLLLMARSPSFTLSVLKSIYKSLLQVTNASSMQTKQRVIIVRVVLELIKIEKLHHSLFSSRDVINGIMKTIEVNEDIHTSEGRELKRMHEQLQSSSNALYGCAMSE